MTTLRFGSTRLNYQIGDGFRLKEEDGGHILLELIEREPHGYKFSVKGGGEKSLSDERITVLRARGSDDFEHYPVAPMGLSEAHHELLTKAFSVHPPELRYVAEIRGEYCVRVAELTKEGKLSLNECFAKAAVDVHSEREAEWRKEFFRMQVMRHTIAGKSARLPEDMVNDNRVGEAYADPKKPSTIESWYRLWEHAGRDIRILVPLFSRRGDHRPKKLQLYEDMKFHITEFYLKLTSAPLTTAWKQMHEAQKKSYNLQNMSGELISYTGFNAFMKKTYAPFFVHEKRKGYTKAMLRHQVFNRIRHDQKAMEEIEIDHCLIDLIVVDETSGRVLGRPWLTVAICRGTRMVVGYHLSFEVPSWASLQRCLAHAFWPKNLEGHGLTNPWPCEGRPTKVFVDNGKEFHSRSLKRAELALGFSLLYLPGRSPWLKGIVERFFGTMNVQVLSHLEGKTFSDTKARGDYKSSKHAKVKLGELKAKLLKWIVDDYHVNWHGGLEGIPLQEWYKRTPPKGMDAVPRFEMLMEFLGSSREKAIGRKGVCLYGHFYFHPELSKLRAAEGLKRKYEIRSNPYDIGSIQLLKPDGKWLTLPSDRPELTVGFSMHQNKVHQVLAKKLVPAGETATEAHFVKAIEIAQAESQEILGDADGRKTVGKVARYSFDNGTFVTKVAGHTGSRPANDDDAPDTGHAPVAAALDAAVKLTIVTELEASSPGKTTSTARASKAPKAEVDPDEPTQEEIDADLAARKARMRGAA